MFNKERGITLIALVITVIVILILSIVAVSAITGNDGLFSKANEAGTLYNQKAESEYSEIQGMLNWGNDRNNGDNGNDGREIDYSDLLNNDSLISKAAEITQAGIQDITVNGITYKANVIILNENVVLNGTNTYAGSTITAGTDGINYIYEFGDKDTDVATATEDAQNMVILKVNGNLTIEQGVKLTACKSDDGFGGPKGMLVFCGGTLTNNGEISMTARGARAAGEDVYLWKNVSGSYETVPAEGGDGAVSISGSTGIAGLNGENRQTGGGGSGASKGTSPLVAGNGAKGTSYSGGSGGGGTYHTSATGTKKGEDAKPNGGAGGRAAAKGGDGLYAYASGGAGNGIGKSAYAASGSNTYGNIDNPDAENGTGGLLILYASLLNNNGMISSTGSNVIGNKYASSDRYAGGGASGGGSINIFVKEYKKIGNIEADGGKSTKASNISHGARGGYGGNGTANAGKIVNGEYIKIQFDIKTNDSLTGKIFSINTNGIQNITTNGKTYSANVIVINGDMVLDGVNTYAGSEILTSTGDIEYIYEFGNKETDVATSTTDAQNMVILKINGNLTINEKVRLTTCKSDDGFGGPKGLYIFCTGKVTNNGEISMTARGARAAGEDVYLWKNLNGTFEFVPAVGAAGGASRTYTWSGTNTNDYKVAGISGTDGSSRKTGGGASGGISARRANYGSGTRTSGAGSAGTSYSGGAGGGGITTNYGEILSAGNAAENGGAGGYGCAYRGSTSFADRSGGGGAGNPGGIGNTSASGAKKGTDDPTKSGKNGTGGLLILYGRELENNGSIVSDGSNGGAGTGNNAGGGSGGGSINIFVGNLIERGTITATGGLGSGNGGSGCVSVGKFVEGRYRTY